jgi:hypothetical protein
LVSDSLFFLLQIFLSMLMLVPDILKFNGFLCFNS